MKIKSARQVLDNARELRRVAEKNARNYRDKAAIEDGKVEVMNHVIEEIYKLVEFENEQKTSKEVAEEKLDTIIHYPQNAKYEYLLSLYKDLIKTFLQTKKSHSALFAHLINNSNKNYDYWNKNINDFIRYLVDSKYILPFRRETSEELLKDLTDYETHYSFYLWNPNAPAC